MNSLQTTEMQTGESRLLRLDGGTCLHLAQGRLSVREMPGWLDAAVPVPARVLRAGEVHVAERSVWVTLDALATCRMNWRCPAPAGIVKRRARWGRWWVAAA